MHLGIIKITYNRTATHFMDDRFMNLWEEIILTLLWQSGTSESATVCFVISWSICYWLLKCRVLSIVCVCEREWVSCRIVCVCLWERESRSHHNRSLCANTYELHHCVTQLCSPLGLELMVKLSTLLTVFSLVLKNWSSRLWKGVLHFRHGLWCSANHNALDQLANQSRLCLEGEAL